MKKKKVACYIDGFSLYHSIDNLNESHLKWLNLWDLAKSLIKEDEELVVVYYFSAYATWKPEAYARHRKYVKALEFFGVTPVMGHFKSRNKVCKACETEWVDHEEKETDVNIALRILSDAFEDVYDRAIIISSDSDLVPAIRDVKTKFPKKSILVATPPKRHEVARDLRRNTSSYRLTKGRVKKYLLPEKVLDEKGKTIVERPMEYDISHD